MNAVRQKRFCVKPNSEVALGSARVPRARLDVPPKPRDSDFPTESIRKEGGKRSFRRDAENRTPEACAPLGTGFAVVKSPDFGLLIWGTQSDGSLNSDWENSLDFMVMFCVFTREGIGKPT